MKQKMLLVNYHLKRKIDLYNQAKDIDNMTDYDNQKKM
jgi:hypothetical protein